jgi:hypothetical protein
MNTTTVLRKGDTLPAYAATLVEGPARTPLDLTGCTVRFHMRSANATALLKVNAAATIVSPTAGTVRYDWAPGDLSEVATYRAEWQITYPSGRILTAPTRGFDTIRVIDELN